MHTGRPPPRKKQQARAHASQPKAIFRPEKRAPLPPVSGTQGEAPHEDLSPMRATAHCNADLRTHRGGAGCVSRARTDEKRRDSDDRLKARRSERGRRPRAVHGRTRPLTASARRARLSRRAYTFTAGVRFDEAVTSCPSRYTEPGAGPFGSVVLRCYGVTLGRPPSSTSSDEGATPRIADARSRCPAQTRCCATTRPGADPQKTVTP